MKALECTRLTCRFVGLTVLDRASLSVAGGETVAVLGENGAGKTTLLNVIAGLQKLEQGQVTLLGQDVSGASFERRHRSGIELIRTFDRRDIWTNVSVIDNVAAAGSECTTREARRRARRWAETFRVPLFDLIPRSTRGTWFSRFLTVPGGQRGAGLLSIGQQKRVALARAMFRFEVFGFRGMLLLDEPFKGLDEATRDEVVELLKEHVCGRVPTLFVEHDRERAAVLADRIFWLENGRLSKHAPKSSVDCARRSRGRTNRVHALPHSGVSCEALWAGYSGQDVLQGLNLHCATGEGMQILGDNGSGKSTLLRVLTGSLRAHQGSVAINGRPIPFGGSIVDLGVGYVPQGGRLVEGLSVAQHLDLARAGRGRQDTGQSEDFFVSHFPEVLRLQGRAGNLSSGQRSLLALWLAFCTDPDLLILDEPTASLAPDVASRLFGILVDEWLKPKKTLIVVEHAIKPDGLSRVELRNGVVISPKMLAAGAAC